MPFWLWRIKRTTKRLVGTYTQAPLAGLPIAGIVYYLLRLAFAVVPDPIGTSPNPSFLRLLVFLLSVCIAVVSGLGLRAYRLKTALAKELRRKMQGIRDMFDCLDVFEEAAAAYAFTYKGHPRLAEDDEWNKLIGSFELETMETLIGVLLRSESPGTTMMERSTGELRITATFPKGHAVDTALTIRILQTPADSEWPCEPEGGEGVAGYAACRGLPVYVPYARSNWGVTCHPASQPESELRFRKLGPPLWKESGRKEKDYKSMISAPATTLVSGVPKRKWKRYAVINIEGTKRDQFDTDDIHAVAVAASIMAQGLEHSGNCEGQTELLPVLRTDGRPFF